MLHRPALLALAVAGAVVATASPALAHDTGAHYTRAALAAPGDAGEGVAMTPLANIQYETERLPASSTAPERDAAQNGSDIEFVTIDGRDYALAGTLRNGMQIVDVTAPAAPTPTAVYDCRITQGDVQVFRQGERVLATFTADSAIAAAPDAEGTRSELNQARFDAACVTEANELGFELDGSELGTFLVDLTNPAAPKTVGFVEVPKGSHNQTVHPSGDYLYNSNSDLIVNSPLPQITIHDISNPAEPRFVQDFSYPPGQPALGEESHDIFFNGTGTRAYVASLGSTLILDTSDPEDPEIVSQFFDIANSLVHGADLVSLPREDGTERDLLITTDEQNGAAVNATCPGGGLHVYDITGDKEQDPLANKLGTWFIDAMNFAGGGACTSHVQRYYPDQKLMTIAWYTAGVRVLDISGLAEFEGGPSEVAFGDGVGMTEVGNFVFDDVDTWSFKTNRIERDGSFFGFGNDLGRGLDVYRFDGSLDVPALAPEDVGATGCDGVPVATAYVDRSNSREVHKRAIDCVIARKIARGSVQTGGDRVFRPTEDVTRAQMATFVLGALRSAGIDNELPEPTADTFSDVEGSVHQEAIETLAAIGVVQGTTGGSFVPDAPITRAQVASFTVRAAQFAALQFDRPLLAESGGRAFTDVPDSATHASNIALGADNALFSGTTPTTFAPDVTVKRDQMASFMKNLLGVAGRGNTVPAGTGG